MTTNPNNTLQAVESTLDFPEVKNNALSLRSAIVAVLLSSISISGFAAGYSVQEMTPPVINSRAIPTGSTARPICLDVNDHGQVACQLEFIQTLVRTPADRLAPGVRIFASYAYRWDSATGVSTLLSKNVPGRFDRVTAINNSGVISGSVSEVGNRPQGAIWTGTSLNTYGVGAVTDINDLGDYVQNNVLFEGAGQASFAGKNIQIHAINNAENAAGKQTLLAPKITGLGELYDTSTPIPAAATVTGAATPLFAISSGISDYSVSELSDNDKLVISGTPNTISALTAASCSTPTTCLFYTSSVGTSGRGVQYIRLNSVNQLGNSVGTDGGVGLLITAPTAAAPQGERFDLNNLVASPVATFAAHGFLNEATGINQLGQIIGLAQKGNGTSTNTNVTWFMSPN